MHRRIFRTVKPAWVMLSLIVALIAAVAIMMFSSVK